MMRSSSIFSGIKRSSSRFIAIAMVGLFALTLALNLIFRFGRGFYLPIYNGSHHLVTPTLMGAGTLGVVVVAVLVGYGKLRFHDFGWIGARLVPGLVTIAVLWIAMQLVEVVSGLATKGQIQLSPTLRSGGWTTVVGVLIGQALGTAPAEETWFRGFLLPQLQIRLGHLNPAPALGLAIVASQAAFALYHLPNLLLGNSGVVGTTALDITSQLGIDFAVGVLLAGIYIRTGNLFLLMGIHALLNAGTSVVATSIDPVPVLLGLAMLILVLTFVLPRPRRLGGAATTPGSPASPDDSA
jgi:membrane protease YdiL (CAAX protease family)